MFRLNRTVQKVIQLGLMTLMLSLFVQVLAEGQKEKQPPKHTIVVFGRKGSGKADFLNSYSGMQLFDDESKPGSKPT